MALRRLFKTGRAVVLAIPKPFRDALHLHPGTDVVVTLKDRQLHISRAIVTPEHLLGAPEPSAGVAPGRKD